MTQLPPILTTTLSQAPLSAPSLKRKSDQIEKDVKQKELLPIFEAFINVIVPDESQGFNSMLTIIDTLSTDDNIMYALHQTPLKKVKSCFNAWMEERNLTNESRERIKTALSNLYPLALVNSSTYDTMEHIMETMPALKRKLFGDPKKQLNTLLRNARELKRQAKEVNTLEQIDSFLPQIERSLRELQQYRELKQFQDPEENKRLIDLIAHQKTVKTETFSPSFVSDYKKFIERLKPLTPTLDSTSAMVQKLSVLKFKLLNKKKEISNQSPEEAPLETRFLKAFGKTFYYAFANYFWDMLLNSQDDPEFSWLFDNGDKLSDTQIDFTLISEVWNKYLPNIDFQDWILATLEGTDPTTLDELENALQEVTKKFNIIHENQSCEKNLRESAERDLNIMMKKMCLTVIRPSASNLKELKNSLTGKTEK